MSKLGSFWVLLFICSSCSHFGSNSEALNMQREVNDSKKMRVDGFYFSLNKTSVPNADVYFFYRNGVVQHMGSVAENEFSIRLRDDKFLKKVRGQRVSWGLYRVVSDTIEFERWYHAGGSEKLALLRKGIILNDSTFLINSVSSKKRGEYDSTNELYHFKKFHPKPDSTNEFIE